MSRMFSIHAFKRDALRQLRGHWGTPVLLTLILGAVYALLNAPTIVQYADQLSVLLDSVKTRDYGAFAAELSKTQNPTLALAVYLLSGLITGALGLAVSRYYILFSADSGRASFGVFLEGLCWWWRGLLAYLWHSLRLGLWALVLAGGAFAFAGIALFVALAAGAASVLSGFSLFDHALFAFPTLAVAAGLYAVFVNRALAYSQVFNIVAEYPDISVIKALDASVAITKGYCGRLFLLYLSFAGWGALSCLTLGAGFLLLAPYASTTLALAYRFLKANTLAADALGRIPGSAQASDATQGDAKAILLGDKTGGESI